jgi:imidazole glycerol-phosphate synthase subunit HisF
MVPGRYATGSRTWTETGMACIRLIARLDIKAPYLIKTVQLEGLRKLGDPATFARRYYEQGIDEIVYIDTVASLYERNTIIDLVRDTAKNVFIPITVGGGVRSLEDARNLLRAGADKIAVNTAAVKNPTLISELAAAFGSQCIVLSVQAKQNAPEQWEAYCDMGREHSGLDAVEWAKRGEELGAGEILITSVDREGTKKGFDLNLVRKISTNVGIPVIASGGLGTLDHFVEVVKDGYADAVAIARVLHYDDITTAQFREAALDAGLEVRAV